MVNIAVIGLGWWGRVIVPLAQGSPHLRVVKAAHTNAAAVEEFVRSHGLDLVIGLEPVLEDPRVQGKRPVGRRRPPELPQAG